MPMGEFECGGSPCGEDPITFNLPEKKKKPPAGVLVDLGLKNEALDENGRHVEVHPVDEGVMLSFGVRKGTLRGNANVGNEFRDLPRLSGEKLVEEVGIRRDRAYPWSRLVANGDVKHEATIVRQPKRGETIITIKYRNLRLDPTKVRTVEARP
jgi:hypothetical protein